MLDEMGGGQAAGFITAITVVAIGLLALFAVLWVIRNRASSTFIRGGRNRQPRLAVLDAAAVDARRRLVLVRRDGTEHLILIGGPTDVVIESGIEGADDGAAAAEEERSVPAANRPDADSAAPHAAIAMAPSPVEGAGRNAPVPLRHAEAPHERPLATATPRPATAVAEPAPEQQPEAAPAGPVPSTEPGRAESPARPVSERTIADEAAARGGMRPPLQTIALTGSGFLAKSGSFATAEPQARGNAEQDQTLDLLEAARTRVLQGPAAGATAHPQEQAQSPAEEAAATDTQPEEALPSPAAQPLSGSPADAYFEIAAEAETPPPAAEQAIAPASQSSGQSEPVAMPHQPAPKPAAAASGRSELSEFEAILEAELTDDLGLDDQFAPAEPADGSVHGDLSGVAPGHAPQPAGRPLSPSPRPEHPRQDTLEEEMDRLLGDLSRSR